MNKATRKRLVIDLNGDWRLYTNSLPSDCAVLGTITRNENDIGAFNHSTERYAQVNNGVVRNLDSRKIVAALAKEFGKD